MNKKGFTLIEIIIVIVILGVLATLAVPRVTAQIEASRASEAVNFLGVIKRAVINCYDSTQDMATCKTSAQLGVTIPAASATLFDYALTNNGTNDLRILATRNVNQGHAPVATSTDCLKMLIVGDTGVATMGSMGAYVPTVTRMGITAAAGTGANCQAW